MTWNAAKARGERPLPALFDAMDEVLDAQAERSPSRAASKRRSRKSGRCSRASSSAPGRGQRGCSSIRAFAPRYDFLVLRGESGEAPQALVDWWTRFQEASHEERAAMLRPDEAPKKRRRTRSRKRRNEGAQETPAPTADE